MLHLNRAKTQALEEINERLIKENQGLKAYLYNRKFIANPTRPDERRD